MNKKNEDEYTLETGMNTNGQPVIVCSTAMYDKIIDECRQFIEEEVKKVPQQRQGQRIKFLARKYPALSVLSTHPTISENNNR